MAEPGAERGGREGGRDLPRVRLRGPLSPPPPARSNAYAPRGVGAPGAGGSQARRPAGARRPLAPCSPPPGCTLLPRRAGGWRHGASRSQSQCLLLKMADSPPRQLQPLGLQRGLTSSPHPHPGDPAEVLADRGRGRAGREPGLPPPSPVPHVRPPLWALEEPVTGERESVTGPGWPRAPGPAARGPYLDICCPAPAAQTRSSACRGAATPHTPGSPARSR